MSIRKTIGKLSVVGMLLALNSCMVGPKPEKITPPALEFDFSEAKGNVLHDKSGGGNNGVIHGAKWVQDPSEGTCLEFDGIDDYVDVPFKNSIFKGDEFTIEILVKPGLNVKKKGFGVYRLLLGQDGAFWNKDSVLGISAVEDRNNLQVYFRYGPENTKKNNQVVTSAQIPISPNVWQKVTWIKSKTAIKLYVNSMPVAFQGIGDKKMISSRAPIRIGGVPTRYFKGTFKNIKIYDRALKIEEKTVKTKIKKQRKPYLLMATSMDESISSTPLLDIQDELIKVFNDSPYDGISLNLLDIYSGQPVIDEATLMEKAKKLKAISKVDIWPRINVNRIYQRKENHCYNTKVDNDAAEKIPATGYPVWKARRESTNYFTKIKGVDICNGTGALDDFYDMWRKGLKFSKFMDSGIVLDFEDYNSGYIGYKVFEIARVQNKPVDEVIKHLIKMGVRIADIVNEEYPDVVIITFFFNFSKIKYVEGKAYYPAYAYIAQGILMRAKEKNIPLTIVEGGETEIHYVNRTVAGLKHNILRRRFYYAPWLKRFPELKLGGTITLWDDASKVCAWTKTDAGTPNPFQSLNDFVPFLRELFQNYDYVWFYQPMCVDYKPFSMKNIEYSRKFHEKLDKAVEKALEE
jgi:hypothetical protein